MNRERRVSLIGLFMILTCISTKVDASQDIGRGWYDILRREEHWNKKENRQRKSLERDMIDGCVISHRCQKGEIVIETELKMIKDVIKNDFLVNDDTAGKGYQWYCSVAMDESGGFIVVWGDYRNGNYDIYAQMFYTEGARHDTNFRVNDDAGMSFQGYPSVAMDGDGNFVVAWEDERNGDSDIYAQRYDPSCSPQGSNFRVNDDEDASHQENPSVAMDGGGNFLIVWEDYRNLSNIYCQRYNSSGIPQGSNFKVNDYVCDLVGGQPSVAMDENGSFVVVWIDYRTGNSDIYAKRYDAEGIPQGSDFKVNDNTGTSYRKEPLIAMKGSGNFVVVWEDFRNDNPDIYAQIYDASGLPEGANFKVNDDAGESYQEYPSIAIDEYGNFMIAWEDERIGSRDIFTQRFDASGYPEGSNFKVNDDTGMSLHWFPSIAADGNSAITWMDYRNCEWDIYSQWFAVDGSPLGPNIKVNEDVGASEQYSPSVAMDQSGNFVITWMDCRSEEWDIYTQRFDMEGTFQGPNFRVNDDLGVCDQWYPSVAMDESGNFAVVWEDFRNGGWDIYSQRYNSSGEPLDSNFMVNDDLLSDHYDPSIAMVENVGFVVVWIDYCMSYYDVYAQRYDAEGTSQGSNFRVNDGGYFHYHPTVTMDQDGNFVIVWTNDYDIYAQRYDFEGKPQGSNFKVNDDTGTNRQWYSSVAGDYSGNFVVVWEDKRNGNYDIYAQRYNAEGSPQGLNFRVNDDEGMSDQEFPWVTVDPQESRFVIVWTDYRNPDGDPEVVAQKYEDGNPVGSNIQINESDLFPYNHQSSEGIPVSCAHDMVAFTWMDNRRHKGFDIYGKLTDWGLVGIEDKTDLQFTSFDYQLEAYPNPFISKATIIVEERRGMGDEGSRSSLLTPHSSVVIYDLSGRLIRTFSLPSSPFPSLKVTWDGRDDSGGSVPAGVYFLKLSAGEYTTTKKLLRVR